jgi:lysophospholipase L1-like esterase
MTNATLDMNIAWSGTVVARSTDPDYLATDHGAGHCFVERFIVDGMGNPDVILLHGGTNDVSNRGKSISLYPGYPIYKASDYSESACPTDAEMKVAFDTADAAITRAQIEAIDDTTFVYAYVKLLSLMHQQYPSAKVVMIIGDWIPAGTRQALLKIAAHYEARYGYKCVDLQEISPYRTSTVIPKEAGCHPNEAGFEVMANYIYQKVGDYID